MPKTVSIKDKVKRVCKYVLKGEFDAEEGCRLLTGPGYSVAQMRAGLLEACVELRAEFDLAVDAVDAVDADDANAIVDIIKEDEAS